MQPQTHNRTTAFQYVQDKDKMVSIVVGHFCLKVENAALCVQLTKSEMRFLGFIIYLPTYLLLSTKYVCIGLFYGHTGHVRFLTSVELGRSVTGQSSPLPVGPLNTGASGVGNPPRRHATFSGPPTSTSLSTGSSTQRYRPITPPPLPAVSASTLSAGSVALVVSGGDGFEDFRASSTDSESAGRDDSTNHLLLWRV